MRNLAPALVMPQTNTLRPKGVPDRNTTKEQYTH